MTAVTVIVSGKRPRFAGWTAIPRAFSRSAGIRMTEPPRFELQHLLAWRLALLHSAQSSRLVGCTPESRGQRLSVIQGGACATQKTWKHLLIDKGDNSDVSEEKARRDEGASRGRMKEQPPRGSNLSLQTASFPREAGSRQEGWKRLDSLGRHNADGPAQERGAHWLDDERKRSQG